jgi:hypothetical protein
MAYKLFAREVSIEGRPDKVRILPLVWKGRLHLVGLQDIYKFTSLEFVTLQTLRLVNTPELKPGDAGPLPEKATREKVAHVILSHIVAHQTEGILDHARKMSDRYELVLAYGGKESEFEKIRFEKKFFVRDASLRGPIARQSYNEILRSAADRFATGAHPDWIYFGDYDSIPLRRNYLDRAIETAQAYGAGFVANTIRDVTASNCVFLVEPTANRKLGWCAENEMNRDIRVYHCLGASLLFSWKCLMDTVPFLDRFPDIYFEIAVPTAVGLAGHKLVSMGVCGREWEHIGFMPRYRVPDLERLQAEGFPFVHPFKDIEGFLKAADEIQTRASRSGSDSITAQPASERT